VERGAVFGDQETGKWGRKRERIKGKSSGLTRPPAGAKRQRERYWLARKRGGTSCHAAMTKMDAKSSIYREVESGIHGVKERTVPLGGVK